MALKNLQKYPTITFSKENLVPESESWISTCKNIRQAFEEHGFFVAIQDKLIPGDLSDGIFQAMDELFSLQEEIKAKNTSDTIFFFGYMSRNVNMPLSESLTIEDSTSVEAVDKFTNLMWPSGNDKFCKVVELYTKKALQMRQTVNKMLFESYGLNKYHESENEYFTDVLRFNKYWPPRSEEYEIASTSHTDKDWISILHQVNQVNGMQIKPKDKDEWITIDVPLQSFVVFAGDALSAWSNGRIHAVVHRVMMQGEEIRYSIAQFAFVKKTVQVPDELVDDDHPLLYKPFDNFELLRFYATDEGRKTENLLESFCGISKHM